MKKKIKTATMTWIHNNNYGSLLQAYALQQFLIENNYDNIIIDYNPNKLTRVINLFRSHNSIKLFYIKYKMYLSKKHSKKVGHDVKGKNDKIEEFIGNMLRTTKKIKTENELKKLQGQYDVYICGSDQIWNPDLLNPPYFFSFLKDENKKISYAPSFGVKSIKFNKKIQIKKYLDSFANISVREEQGLKILDDLNMNISNIPVVVDPTLLLTEEKWKKLTEKSNDYGNYILCYFLKENQIYWKSVKFIAKKLNLEILIIPNCEDSYNQNAKIIDNVGPKEWLALIENAKFILTDSFHGIIFSLIFHKDFYAYKRFDENSVSSQNSRVENIMKKIGLEKRLYDNKEEITIIESIENYYEIDEIIKKEKEKSINYLINAIEK